ncbi:MAG: universal stress protein [Planctomycetes bacterium]|nr:universal stress protein [Planctomycetota bacterium]
MLIAENRPRNLSWVHAGPLLFGDWGTSRLYVLGLAMAATGTGSVFYLGALSVLMACVAWAYSVICRVFPNGGGVYAASRTIHPLLSVVGATLLLGDYIVTAAISLVDAYHYFGLPEGPGQWWLFWACLGAIILLGVINWLGAKSAGRFALIIAIAAMGFSAIIALMSIPYVREGFKYIHFDTTVPPQKQWVTFTQIVLALSGVEAVANMTGLMKQPVEKTAKKTIWPVLAEVAVLNIVFGIALVGVTGMAKAGLLTDFRFTDEQVKNAAMKVLAVTSGQNLLGPTAGFVLGKSAAIVFGLLLISAANTAIMAMVSVLYALAQDKELPKPLTRLNYSGVPWIGLIIACCLPAIVLFFKRDIEDLAHLYAIGVCGAISLNVACCAFSRAIAVKTWERLAMGALTLVMGSVFVTIAFTKHEAAIFAGGLVAALMGVRFVYHAISPRTTDPVPEPQIGWMAELRNAPPRLDPSKPKIMLAARGRDQAEFAVSLAKKRGATLFVIYVRTLRVMDMGSNRPPQIESDPDAQMALGSVAVLARESGVPFFPIYVTAEDAANEILDYTVTYGCDTLIMGKSRRSLFARRVAGDVAARVAENLPDLVTLITRAAAQDSPLRSAPTPSPTAVSHSRVSDPTDQPPPT